jgi:hypothetical protein
MIRPQGRDSYWAPGQHRRRPGRRALVQQQLQSAAWRIRSRADTAAYLRHESAVILRGRIVAVFWVAVVVLVIVDRILRA